MPYLILVIAVIIGLILVIRGLAALDPKRAWAFVRLLVVVAVLGAILYFAATRGLVAALMALFFLSILLGRWRGLTQMMNNMRGPRPGSSSDVETAYLRMSLDHDSGTLDGTVLAGKFRGRRLGELSEAEVLELLHECRVEDTQSAGILETYLDRIYGPGWRGGDAGAGSGSGAGPAGGRGTMSREQALEILGLGPGAGEAEIKDAHHRLMMKLHPDQGGSTYLASQLNQAKDFLLGN